MKPKYARNLWRKLMDSRAHTSKLYKPKCSSSNLLSQLDSIGNLIIALCIFSYSFIFYFYFFLRKLYLKEFFKARYDHLYSVVSLWRHSKNFSGTKHFLISKGGDVHIWFGFKAIFFSLMKKLWQINLLNFLSQMLRVLNAFAQT